MFLSIIIPVYNSSAFLGKCLNSCFSQDLSSEDFEIIVIDDGSLDNSFDIALDYSKRFPNIKLIKQPNAGASVARNRAINYAEGDYIWFVDSDDYIKENILGSIAKLVCTNNVEILFVDWQGCNEDGSYCDHTTHYRKYSSKIMSGNEYLRDCAGYLLLNVAYIIKREFLLKTNIRLKVNACYEDTDFYFRLLPLADKVMMYNERVYFYINHAASFSSISVVSERKFLDLMENLELAQSNFEKGLEAAPYFAKFRDAIILTAFQMAALAKDNGLYDILANRLKKCRISHLHTTQLRQRPIALFYNLFGSKATYILSKLIYGRSIK